MTVHHEYRLLAEPIQRVLWDLKWDKLRPIQREAIKVILGSDNDLIISAQTAAGKTEAAFLPILSSISANPHASVRAIYVGPLKALINDQFRRLEELCEHAEIPVHRWHGDVSSQQKHRLLKSPSGVLLITPESLEALFVLRSNALQTLFHSLTDVVIDELHAMEGNERGNQLRSLLFRLERYCTAKPRLVALSATLGDATRTAEWMRPFGPEDVRLIQGDQSQKSIRYGLFAYRKPMTRRSTDQNDESYSTRDDAPPMKMSEELFNAFCHNTNLIFANSKADVEWYSDELNQLAKSNGQSGQFLVHHGALSKEIREHTEQMMQSGRPYTTICTSTLELGIDIGNVTAVGQIGCPGSVASLVQRLGRSGRRDEQPQIMRLCLLEEDLPVDAPLWNQLRPRLIQAIALTELMLEKWVEPPRNSSGDLSTLVQQVLSVIKETGGITASLLFDRLIRQGSFREIPETIFISVLRVLGKRDLIEQTAQGDLILGLKGEELVDDYNFYAAFASPPEYRVVQQGTPLGMLPTDKLPSVGDHLLLAGRRWRVTAIDHDRREVAVQPGRGRKAPLFAGGLGDVHDVVRQRMRDILFGSQRFPYLNDEGQQLLEESRKTAENAGLRQSDFVRLSPSKTLWFPWRGSKATETLELILRRSRLDVWHRETALEIDASPSDIQEALAATRRDFPSALMLAAFIPMKVRRKHDWLLDEDLLTWSAAVDLIDVEAATETIDELMQKRQ